MVMLISFDRVLMIDRPNYVSISRSGEMLRIRFYRPGNKSMMRLWELRKKGECILPGSSAWEFNKEPNGKQIAPASLIL